MLLVLDAHVPPELGDFFRQDGHEVVEVAMAFPEGTPDASIQQWCHEHEAIWVTWDKDSRNLKRRSEGERERYFRMGRITFINVPYDHGHRRLQAMWGLIRTEYNLLLSHHDRRLIVEIQMGRCTFFR